MTVQISLSDGVTTANYTLYVFYSRYHISFEPLTDFMFYSRYKVKRVRLDNIEHLSFFVSEKTKVFLDVIYLELGNSIKKTVELKLPEANHMAAYNVSPVE